MWYSVNDSDQRFELETISLGESGIDLEIVAKKCAEDFDSNHDGWEYSWPLDFLLYETEDGPSVAKVFVEKDVKPVFYARIRK